MDSARHGEAEIVGEAGDAAVLDAGFRAELEGGDDGAGIDLNDLAVDVELRAFFDEGLRGGAQLVFADGGGIVAAMEEGRRRQAKAGDGFGGDGDGADTGVGPLADGDFARSGVGGGRGCGFGFAARHKLRAQRSGRRGC